MRISQADSDDVPSRGRERLRFLLGMAQMATATVALVLLVETGVSRWCLAATATTCVLTSLSVLLFGGWRRRR